MTDLRSILEGAGVLVQPYDEKGPAEVPPRRVLAAEGANPQSVI